MSFRQQVILEQITWANKCLADRKRGHWKHDHILRPMDWEYNLWPGIRSGAPDSLSRYLSSERIRRHRDATHLNSSWIACANLYFPFRANGEARQLLAGFLAQFVPEIERVETLELEYEPQGDLSPASLLGEKGGGRGFGQTSPDIGLRVRTRSGGDGIVLLECKYCESNFEACSGTRTKPSEGHPVNHNPSRCGETVSLLVAPERQCHLASWGRKYWDHLSPAIERPAFERLFCCPAKLAGYQLFRQQAMAEGIARSKEHTLAVTGVAYDARNAELLRCLGKTGITDLKSWGGLFHGRAEFITMTHQSWVKWVREHGEERWKDWLAYISSRYGY